MYNLFNICKSVNFDSDLYYERIGYEKDSVKFAAFAAFLPLRAQITLDECIRLAEENYPLIRRYDLCLEVVGTQYFGSQQSWLPQMNVYGRDHHSESRAVIS